MQGILILGLDQRPAHWECELTQLTVCAHININIIHAQEALAGWTSQTLSVCRGATAVPVQSSEDDLGRTVWRFETNAKGLYTLRHNQKC